MIKWLVKLCARFLNQHGYVVVDSHVPQIILMYGTGTMKKLSDGGTEYVIYMPKGHYFTGLVNTNVWYAE